MAAEAPAGGGNVLTRKIGPLPTWAWVSIVGAVVVAWALYARSKSNQAASSDTTSSTTPPDVFLVSPNGTTPAGGATATTPPAQTTPTGSKPPVTTHPIVPRTITAGGPHATKDLYQLAKQYGVSEAELIRMNPQLKKYEGTGKPIPKKTKIKV